MTECFYGETPRNFDTHRPKSRSSRSANGFTCAVSLLSLHTCGCPDSCMCTRVQLTWMWRHQYRWATVQIRNSRFILRFLFCRMNIVLSLWYINVYTLTRICMDGFYCALQLLLVHVAYRWQIYLDPKIQGYSTELEVLQSASFYSTHIRKNMKKKLFAFLAVRKRQVSIHFVHTKRKEVDDENCSYFFFSIDFGVIIGFSIFGN